MDIDLESYINIPYQHNGRSREGVDCYGLVKIFYEEVFDIILDDYSYDQNWYKQNSLMKNKANVTGFHQITDNRSKWKTGDVICFQMAARNVNHAGIWITSDSSILHSERSNRSYLENYTRRLATHYDSAWRHSEHL